MDQQFVDKRQRLGIGNAELSIDRETIKIRGNPALANPLGH